jgi:molybdate transport system regulatory protein
MKGQDHKKSERQGSNPDLTQPEDKGSRRVLSISRKTCCLDPVQLGLLEKSFRSWAEAPSGTERQWSRKRILLIFLLIRYTGAKLNEVLNLSLTRDIDLVRQIIHLGRSSGTVDRPPRTIPLPGGVSSEIKALLPFSGEKDSPHSFFKVDPGHVRRKFYERAEACGFSRTLSSPDGIRKARAVELMQGNMPLPVVQRVMGHATPNLVSSLVSFSDEDMGRMTRFFLDRESSRRTSARNAFFGKISDIKKGDIQSGVTLTTLNGDAVATVITNESLKRLGLKIGSFITAEVKAPQVLLYKGEGEPRSTAENRFPGKIVKIHKGGITSEYVVRIADGTFLCALVSSETARQIDLRRGDPVWAVFSSFSVVLHVD